MRSERVNSLVQGGHGPLVHQNPVAVNDVDAQEDADSVEATLGIHIHLFLNRNDNIMWLSLSLPRVMNLKFSRQPHQKCDITQYGELGFSYSLLRWKMIILPILTTSLILSL